MQYYNSKTNVSIVSLVERFGQFGITNSNVKRIVLRLLAHVDDQPDPYGAVADIDRLIGYLTIVRKAYMRNIIKNDSQIVNVTPFHVRIANKNGQVYRSFPRGEVVAKVYTEAVQVGDLGGTPIVNDVVFDVSDIPYPAEGTLFIVTRLVFNHFQDRSDFITPNMTGVIRNDNGNVYAIRSFLAHNR